MRLALRKEETTLTRAFDNNPVVKSSDNRLLFALSGLAYRIPVGTPKWIAPSLPGSN